MPRYKEQTQEHHKEMVRQTLTMIPTAGVWKIKDTLAANGLILDATYILKLKKKIISERRLRVDRKKVEERIAEIEDKVTQVQTKLFEILMNSKTKDEAKIKAAEKIVNSEIRLLQAQMDAGIYERRLGTLKAETEIPEMDMNNPRVQAMINLGLIKSKNIIHMTEAKEVEPIKLNADNNKKTTNRGSRKSK